MNAPYVLQTLQFNLYSSKLEGLLRSLDNLTFIIGFILEFVFNKIVNEFKMNIQLQNQLRPKNKYDYNIQNRILFFISFFIFLLYKSINIEYFIIH